MSKKVQRPKTLPQHLKHWFVPHQQNDHRPHLIRMRGLAVMTLLIIGVQVTANLARPAAVRAQPATARVLAYATNITPVDLLNLTNQQRVANGLAPLVMDARLNHSAALKAANMFAENYWAHVSPSGIQPWYWFTQAGYNYTYAGENLAMDFDTSAGTVQGWMNSAGHRANILNPAYRDVGFAVQNGTLTGEQTTLVVAHYGATSAPAVAAAPKPVVGATPPPVVVAATPTLTPEPATPTPTPAPTGTPHPVAATGSITNPSAPAPQQYSLFKPLSLIRTLNLSSLVTLGLLLLLFIVYVFTHITVWRKGLGRWRSTHYRFLAAAQVSGLAAAIVMLAVSGFGRVG
ncbi:MAG: hypothetical protein NVSMB39_1180 [Candidatus Saccharimonadales bacterium]